MSRGPIKCTLSMWEQSNRIGADYFSNTEWLGVDASDCFNKQQASEDSSFHEDLITVRYIAAEYMKILEIFNPQ